MTISKAQEQSLHMSDLNLENEYFSHGQLYVACSRVGKISNLYVYAENRQIKNLVHSLDLQ